MYTHACMSFIFIILHKLVSSICNSTIKDIIFLLCKHKIAADSACCEQLNPPSFETSEGTDLFFFFLNKVHIKFVLYAVRNMMCTPESVSTISLSSPTFIE